MLVRGVGGGSLTVTCRLCRVPI